MTFLGQDWVCRDWIEHSDGRQCACSRWSITILGQDWVFFVRRIPFLSWNWLFFACCMTILGQDWVCRDWIKYSDGRQNVYSHWGITILGQVWLFFVRRIPFFRQDWLFSVRTITILGQDWSYLKSISRFFKKKRENGYVTNQIKLKNTSKLKISRYFY